MLAINRDLGKVPFYRVTGAMTRPIRLATGDRAVTWNTEPMVSPVEERDTEAVYSRVCDCDLHCGECICLPQEEGDESWVL